MKEKRLNISKHCGNNRVSREDGLALRIWIEREWDKNDRLIFDFDNVLIASVSFIDEAFAKLAFGYSKDKIVSKLKFENLRPFDRALLNDLLLARLRETKTRTPTLNAKKIMEYIKKANSQKTHTLKQPRK